MSQKYKYRFVKFTMDDYRISVLYDALALLIVTHIFKSSFTQTNFNFVLVCFAPSKCSGVVAKKRSFLRVY